MPASASERLQLEVLVAEVLTMCRNNVHAVGSAVRSVLSRHRTDCAIENRGRWIYLNNLLTRKAKNKIKAEQKKAVKAANRVGAS